MKIIKILSLLLLVSISALAQEPNQQELNPDLDGYAEGVRFGWRVAMEGNTMAITMGYDRGVIAIFELEDDRWVLKGRLTATSLPPYYKINADIDLQNNTVAVTTSEFVYVFEKPASGWQDMNETAKLTAIPPSGLESLTEVKIEGNRIFALSTYTANGIYVFEKESGAGWSDQEQSPTLALDIKMTYEYTGSMGTAENYAVMTAKDSAFVFEHDEAGQWLNDGKPVKTLLVQNDSTRNFGVAVATHGNTIAFSAEETYTSQSGKYDRGIVFTFERSGTSWADSEIDTARIFSPYASVSYSRSLILQDTTLLFAEGSEDVVSFRKNGDSWDNAVLMQSFYKYDPARNFGSYLSLAGKYLAVSHYRYYNRSYESGAVYMFEFDSTTLKFNEVQMLTIDDVVLPPNAADGDYFGYDVAKNDSVVVVGSPRDDRSGADRGCVYIFEKDDNGEWVRAMVLTASDGVDGARFGSSVDLEGDVIMVGSPSHDDNRGAVYYFIRNGHSWSAAPTEYMLPAEDLQADDYFGYSVNISGDAMFAAIPGLDKGMVKVYTKNGSWTQTPNFTINLLPFAAPDDISFFGNDMDVSGDHVIVGQSFNNTTNPRAFLFEKQGDSWANVFNIADLKPSDASAYHTTGNAAHYFGTSVAMDDDVAVVSGYRYGAGHSAYIYRKPDTGWIDMDETSKVDSDHQNIFFSIFINVDIEDNWMTMAVMGRTIHQDIYLYTSPDGSWTEPVLEKTWSDDYGYYAELAPNEIILSDYYNNAYAGKVTLIPLLSGIISLGDAALPGSINAPNLTAGESSSPYGLTFVNTGMMNLSASVELTGNLSSSSASAFSIPPNQSRTFTFTVQGDEIGDRTGQVKISSNIPGFEEKTIQVTVFVEERIVGIEQELHPSAIYPNPTAEVVNIRLTDAKVPANARLYNNTGRLVFETEEFLFAEGVATVTLPALPSGLYLLHIDNRPVGNIVIR